MKLILVRHGETLSNRENRVQGITDTELSDHGYAQVEKLAESLRNEPIDCIVSSPLKRAYQTAQAISKFHKTAIEVENNLQEMNHGDFENVTIAELKEKHLPFLKQWFNNPASIAMPNGESLYDLQMRAWSVIEKIIENSKNTIVVSHGMAIMTILCKIKDMELSHAREMLVNIASKSYVAFENGKGVITMFNDTSHLKDI